MEKSFFLTFSYKNWIIKGTGFSRAGFDEFTHNET